MAKKEPARKQTSPQATKKRVPIAQLNDAEPVPLMGKKFANTHKFQPMKRGR